MKVTDGLYWRKGIPFASLGKQYYLERVDGRWRKKFENGERGEFHEGAFANLSCDEWVQKGSWTKVNERECDATLCISPDKTLFYIVPDDLQEKIASYHQERIDNSINPERIALKVKYRYPLVIGNNEDNRKVLHSIIY